MNHPRVRQAVFFGALLGAWIGGPVAARIKLPHLPPLGETSMLMEKEACGPQPQAPTSYSRAYRRWLCPK